jgi:hypothetical protein
MNFDGIKPELTKHRSAVHKKLSVGMQLRKSPRLVAKGKEELKNNNEVEKPSVKVIRGKSMGAKNQGVEKKVHW